MGQMLNQVSFRTRLPYENLIAIKQMMLSSGGEWKLKY